MGEVAIHYAIKHNKTGKYWGLGKYGGWVDFTNTRLYTAKGYAKSSMNIHRLQNHARIVAVELKPMEIN